MIFKLIYKEKEHVKFSENYEMALTTVHKQYCVQSTNSKIHLPVSYDVKATSIKLSMHLHNDSVRPLFLIFMPSAIYHRPNVQICSEKHLNS